MDNLSGIPVFVCVAEKASFVEAARQLGVTASAVGKTVMRLETKLGVRLFHRNTRSMTLTAEGTLFLKRCRRILLELEAAEQELGDGRTTPKGRLRVSLPSIGALLLPILSDFMNSYPAVELDISVSDRKVDLIEEGFDAAIRIGDTDDSRMMSKTLGLFRRNLVASPKYLSKAGYPKSALDLLSHTCLLYRFPSTGKIEPWPVAGWERLIASGQLPGIKCDSIEALTFFAREGRGIACLPDFEATPLFDDNSLLQLQITEAVEPRPLTILWPTKRHLSPKLRVFIDHLRTRLSGV